MGFSEGTSHIYTEKSSEDVACILVAANLHTNDLY